MAVRIVPLLSPQIPFSGFREGWRGVGNLLELLNDSVRTEIGLVCRMPVWIGRGV